MMIKIILTVLALTTVKLNAQVNRFLYFLAGDPSTTSPAAGNVDGPATTARFSTPYRVIISSVNNDFYIVEDGNHQVRRMDSTTFEVTTVVGDGVGGDFAWTGVAGLRSAPGTSTRLQNPRYLNQDSNGLMYISDFFNFKLKTFDVTTGIVSEYAGNGTDASQNLKPLTDQVFGAVAGTFFNTNNELFVCGAGGAHSVYRIDMVAETVEVIAGTGVQATSGDTPFTGPATSEPLGFPYAIFQDTSGAVYFSERNSGSIRSIDTGGILTIYAGFPFQTSAANSAAQTDSNIAATTARFTNRLRDIQISSTGDMFIADTNSHIIRRVDSSNIVTTVVGTGSTVDSYTDGDAATLNGIRTPTGFTLLVNGDIYFTEGNAHRIRAALTDITSVPTSVPTSAPTISPTISPTSSPTSSPTISPSAAPTASPSAAPTASPSAAPTASPSAAPTASPTPTERYVWNMAGTGVLGYNGEGLLATLTQLATPYDVWIDSNDMTYIADNDNQRIRLIDAATGRISDYAGDGVIGFRGEGAAATFARFRYPRALLGNTNNDLYVSDTFNHRVRVINMDTTVITTAAGGGEDSTSTTLPATDATLNVVTGLYFDDVNNHLYFCEGRNHALRRLTVSDGTLVVVAGTIGVVGFSGDGGQATSATMNFPFGVTLDTDGNIYVSERENWCVRRIATDGIITTFAGQCQVNGYSGDGGPATDALFSGKLRTIRTDTNGIFYISDTNNQRIRAIDANNIIITEVGTGDPTYNGNGLLATLCNIRTPMGLFITPDGEIVFAEGNGNRIRGTFINGPSVSPTAAPTPPGFVAPSAVPTSTPTSSPTYRTKYIYQLAGNSSGAFQGDGGDATLASIFTPYGVWLCQNDDILIVDNRNDRIRMVDRTTNIITTYAGNGVRTLAGDGGPATDASLNHPRHVLEYEPGTVFISDGFNRRIRRVVSGTIESYVGGGVDPVGTTRSTVEVGLSMGMFVDDFTDTSNHKLYFCDSYSEVVRMLDLNTDAMSIVAGTINTRGAVSDVQATSAELSFPWGVYMETTGVMYVSERDNYAVRRIATDGILTTFAGTLGTNGFAGDGTHRTNAIFSFRTRQVWGDSAGNVYVSDTNNHRIRKIRPATGIILTEVGTGLRAFNGNGMVATETNIRTPTGIYVTTEGEIYFAEGHGQRVRAALYATPTAAPVV